MEYRYSTKCPVHRQNIETRRSQSFKYDGNVYGGPMFYCGRCKKYYLFVEGKTSFEKLKSVAPSGLTIDIRKGTVTKSPVKKKGEKKQAKVTVDKQKNELVNKTKKTSVKKGKKKHQAIIKKNNHLKKLLQESMCQIRCEMNCPIHPERVMMTKNCIDVENHKRLPLFYCIECESYYVSCNELKIMKLGRLNRKDFFNCESEITITNPQNGALNNVGSFSSTVNLENEEVFKEESIAQVIKAEKTLLVDRKHKQEEQINDGIVFEDWSYEDTEDELFKDFIQNT